METDISLLVETNTKWDYTNIKKANTTIKKKQQQLRTAMNGSDECTDSDYQPGGVYCGIHGNWTGRIIERIKDSTGLGRWAGFRLECKHQKHLIIVAIYRPTPSHDKGDNTCYSQQWRLLRNKATTNINPKPRDQLIKDLTSQIRTWQHENNEIIIGIDANESLDTPKSAILKLLQDTSLTSLNKAAYAPITYARGKSCIDFLLGTPNIAKSIKSNGYFPFFAGAWHSDHRALYVDIDTLALFNGDPQHIENPMKRNLQSTNRTQTTKFLETLCKNKALPQLATQLFALNHTKSWTSDQHEQLEQIDREFTNALLQAESKCRQNESAPWSPALHEAYLIQTYWKKTISGQLTRKSVHSQLNEIKNKLSDPTKLWQGNINRSARTQLRHANKNLTNIKRQAYERRQEYLIQQHQQYTVNNEADKAKILAKIRKAEHRKRCYNTIKEFNKPQGEAGGLSHILLKQGDQTVRIQNKDEMENLLFERNRQHFAQAHCTPCASGTLAPILGNDGLTIHTKLILKGTSLDPVHLKTLPPTATEILAELKQKRPSQRSWISTEEMIEGFHKWREATTTSPSGKHLGIYKTLTKTYRSNPPSPKQDEATIQAFRRQYGVASLALRIQNLLINLAIQHTHTFDRWQVIHNFFLEKLPGQPFLDKLRVIHLYEADWNLILKFFIAYKLNLKACREKTVATEQAGGRPGKNAADTAATTAITNEIIMLQKLAGTLLYHDAKACFDRIIENLSNTSLLAEGLNPRLVRLHAQTLGKAKYHIKTKYGIATTPNGHMSPDPFYGTGQGAADSMPRWGFLSDTAIKAYNKLAISKPIVSPIHNSNQVTTKIRAYVDDTNCPTITNKNDLAELKATLIHNAKTWERLLFTIGGKLELTKCKFSTFYWTTDEMGTVKIETTPQIGSIKIPSSETLEECEINEIAADKEYKLLGVQMTLTGNTLAQEAAMKEKCQHMGKVFTLAPLSSSDAHTGFKTVLLPKLKYGLSATSIPWYKLDDIQQPLIHTILPKMGINRHFPRAAVFAPEHFGGLGVQQLSAEQGLAHIQYIVGSIRAQTDEHPAIYILLESFIILSGLTGSPLENMTSTEYIDAPWIETTRIFLNSINATIQIPDLHIIKPYRKNDKGIMEQARLHTTDITTLQQINNCRLYLQVNTLADITTPDGTAIHPEAYYGLQDNQSNPQLWTKTKSTLKWPLQPRPPQTAWRKWQRWIQQLTTKTTLLLRSPLRERYSRVRAYRTWTDGDIQTIPQDHTQTPPVEIPRQTWTHRTFHKLENAKQIDIIIHSITSYENCAFFWSLAADNDPIMDNTARLPPRIHAAQNQGTLCGIIDALETVGNEYSRRYAPKPILTINIWLHCSKTVRKCTTYGWLQHTASTAMNEEDELYRKIHERCAQTPTCCFRRIDKQSPEAVRQISTTNTLPTRIVQDIPRIYTLPQPRITVTLNGEPITCNTIQILRNAYGSQQYCIHLQEKHQWTEQVIDTIDWNILGTTIQGFTGSQQRTIQKYINGWLPTNAHDSTGRKDAQRLCPSCNKEHETNMHFIQCPTDREEWKKAISTTLECKADLPQHTLQQLLQDTLHQIADANTIPKAPPDHLPIQYYTLYEEQSHIGWHHILAGRWSKKWVEIYDNITGTTNGETWARRILSKLWKQLLQKWKRRCEHEHTPTTSRQEQENERMNEQIDKIYSHENEIDHIDRLILHTPIDSIKTLKPKPKKAWIRRAQLHVQKAIQRAKTRQQQKHKAITTFFQPIDKHEITMPRLHREPIRRQQSHAESFDPP
jgi:hypothetical protein